MRIKSLFAILICLGIGAALNAQKLSKFGADMGKKSLMGKEIRVPYTDLVSYYGYVKPGAVPDEKKNGKNFYYLYIWIPAVAPELGIRMISPIPEGMAPDATDFVSANYKGNEGDTKNYFDTWITLERANEVMTSKDIMKGKTSGWMSYGVNDDSGEMPAQPSGSKYNSLMRITSEVGNPTKALVVGLYRIGFTTYKTGDVVGSFLAQVGAPVKLPGVVVASSLEELMKSVK